MKKKRPKKKAESTGGWYKVDSIQNHQIVKEEGRKVLQFEVKWANYDETTWENFDPFVKDTTPMAEKYII